MIEPMREARCRLLIAALAAAAIGGCGSGSGQPATGTHAAADQPPGGTATQAPSSPGGQATPPPQPRGTITLPTPAPTGIAAAAADVAVIRGWSDALRHGDVRQAAGFFALPSEMINGVDSGGQVPVIRIQTTFQARLANAALPCGAVLISTDKRGRYVNALFRLTGRPGPGGASCIPGVGQTARTNFVIKDGRIVEWIRAPDDPGDNGTARRRRHRAPAPVPSSPTLPGTPTPVA
jgi:hypothetical protein